MGCHNSQRARNIETGSGSRVEQADAVELFAHHEIQLPFQLVQLRVVERKVGCCFGNILREG